MIPTPPDARELCCRMKLVRPGGWTVCLNAKEHPADLCCKECRHKDEAYLGLPERQWRKK